jgi:hypothetical protein
MPMPPYPVLCYTRDCGRPALYKIAARWTDGVTAELKTYALCCAECLPEWFRRSRQKQKECRLTTGESLDAPNIFHLAHGQRDQQLHRATDEEAQLRG